MAKAKRLKTNAKKNGDKNTNIEELLDKAYKAGIIDISAGGMGLSESIVKDAIRTSELVKKYYAEHPLEKY